jgi:hypothetical protein
MTEESYPDRVCGQIKGFFEENGISYEKGLEKETFRFDARVGRHVCVMKVYRNGTVQVQGPHCPLRTSLNGLKDAIDRGGIAAALLPPEIESFPDSLRKRISEIDDIIVTLLTEAITCYRANATLGCAFLLGAASEKAIWLLIDSYASSIADERNRDRFTSRVNGKFISKAYEEFKQSFASCKTKPKDAALTHDLDVQIEASFNFCRVCRNAVGHPQIPPYVEPGAVLANLGQFVQYMDAIYRLIRFFKTNTMVL